MARGRWGPHLCSLFEVLQTLQRVGAQGRKYSAGAVILLSYMAMRILLDVRILAYPMGIDLLIFIK